MMGFVALVGAYLTTGQIIPGFIQITLKYYLNQNVKHSLVFLLSKLFFFEMTPEAERFNGWAAMLGFVAALGAYVTTGQIIPGWF